MAAPKKGVSRSSNPQGTVAIGNTPVTQAQWQSGALANALVPGSYTAPSPQPVDPAFESQRLTAGRNIALGNAEGAYQQGNTNFDYGYNPDGSINASNPYSRAALLQLGYENQQRGTTNSMAARGQLYSGAIENQRGIDSRGYAVNESNNRLAYQRATHGIQANRLGTMANNSLGVGDADFNSLLKATYPGT